MVIFVLVFHVDIHFVHEAMQDPEIGAFFDAVMQREVLSVVPPPPGVNLEAYKNQIARRFSNPRIGDTIARLCFDGSNRQPKFVLPSVRDRLKSGAAVLGLALVSALWCRYCYGESESGKPIAPNDPSWGRLQTAAKAARTRPQAFLEMRDIFGELADDPVYVAAFSGALTKLWAQGVRTTLSGYLAEKS